MDMSKLVAKRIKMERAIISRLVKDGLKLGYVVSVCDGEEWTVKKSKSYKAVMNAIQTTDEDILRFRKENGELVGSFYMVYGNDGYDVISDYSDNELSNELIKGADSLSDKYELQ
jgi:hypothetical protein